MAGTHYRDLIAWQEAMKLAEDVSLETSEFPNEERYGLTAQLRRAAVSVPSNIAEGQARQSKRDFRRFLRIARGSLAELDTQMELAVRLQMMERAKADRLIAFTGEVGKIVAGSLRSQVDPL